MKKATGVSLDMALTGHILNDKIKKSGYKVSEIQRMLRLACPQPVYRWMNGQALPSIDHLFSLSRLLKVSMEDLIVERQDEEMWQLMESPLNLSGNASLKAYYGRIMIMRMG